MSSTRASGCGRTRRSGGRVSCSVPGLTALRHGGVALTLTRALPSSGAASLPPPRHAAGIVPYSGSRPPSTGPPVGPPLHHPSPLPPSSASAVPALSAASNVQSRASTPAQQPQQHSKDDKPVQSASFDPDTAPKDLKKEGSDWMTMFNPNVKRVLDVGLVHTLVHDSCVSRFRCSHAAPSCALTDGALLLRAASSAACASRPTARSSLLAATATRRCTTRRRAPRSRASPAPSPSPACSLRTRAHLARLQRPL